MADRRILPSTAVEPRMPARLHFVLSGLPFWQRGTPEQRRTLATAVQEARQRSANRKARVAAHPDLAERLRHSLGYQRFDQWSGFVPSTTNAEGKLNPSPVRIELIAILREVADREAAA